MSDPRFVSRDAVRCPDCDLRTDLHDVGYPLKEARARIRMCGGCGGAAEVAAPSRIDPYAAGVDASDPYVKRRAERAARAVITHAPRPLRHRFFDAARLESLMSEEPTHV